MEEWLGEGEGSLKFHLLHSPLGYAVQLSTPTRLVSPQSVEHETFEGRGPFKTKASLPLLQLSQEGTCSALNHTGM